MLFHLAAALALATASTFASQIAPTATTREEHTINPPLSALVTPRSLSNLPTVLNRHVHLSNARRLAAGLKPNPPKRRSSNVNLVARESPSPSPSPGVQADSFATSGYVEGMDEEDDTPLGVISSVPNQWGQFGLTNSEDPDEHAIFGLSDFGQAASGNPITIRIRNPSNPDYSSLGAVTGYSSESDDITPASRSYAFLAGTGETLPADLPSMIGNTFSCNTGIEQRAESAIFTVDPTTGILSAHWVNGDSTVPETHIGFNKEENMIVLAGDKDAFTDAYGDTQWLKLRFVPCATDVGSTA